MTIYAQTITNPGAESASTTGWTSYGDTLAVSTNPNSVGVHSGSYAFYHVDGFAEDTGQYQDLAVGAPLHAAIDAETAAVRFSAWFNNDGFDVGSVQAFFYDGSMVLLGSKTPDHIPSSPGNTWAKQEYYAMLPAGTRTIRLLTSNHTGGFASRARWDDFELDISDAGEVDWPTELALHTHQLGAYVWGTFPTAATISNQAGALTYAAAETSTGVFNVNTYQIGAYAWVRGRIDRRDLRAWPFTQDDHDFWVVQLGEVGTLVYDSLTEQWAQWRSPGYAYWRGNDGVQWEGWNICCDTESGKLWIIDPEGRLDEDTTPITSVVTGGISVRMRKNVPCYMAELAVSEGDPPTGIDEGDVGISLRTSDDQGITYVNHGEVLGQGIGEDLTVRWYSLGNIPATGRVFEITDTGYARRIDGLNVEVPDDGSN